MLSEVDTEAVNQGILSITAGVIRTALSQVTSLNPFGETVLPTSEVQTLSTSSSSPLPEISLDKVSWHDSETDCWIVVYDRVYDVTSFLKEHPGGEEIILEYAGRDATFAFRGVGHTRHAWRALDKYLIGELPVHERIFKSGSQKIFENAPLPSVAVS